MYDACRCTPRRLPGLLEQAAQSRETVEQQQVVGVARDPGHLGHAPRGVLLQTDPAQRVGKHLDADAVAAVASCATVRVLR